MAYLKIENFHKSFGETEVLKGIDFQLEKGDVVSIIGSSGSGKTTLLRCINLLETIDDGYMNLDGEVLLDTSLNKVDDDATLREKRLHFGMVFQSFNLFPQYSVKQNITLAPTLLLKDKISVYKKKLIEKYKNDKTVSKKQINQMVKAYYNDRLKDIERESKELLTSVELVDKADAYPCELSGGQCQRVAIARALALRPKILCFDEPTSALDPELTAGVLKVIKELKDRHFTMIIVTHEMGFAKNVSDKVVFMANGVIEEQGTPAELFDNPKSNMLKAFLSNITEKDSI